MRDDSEEEDMIFDVYAVDKHGKRSPVDRDDVGLWKELRIVGVLRYMARQLSLDSFDPKITPLHLNDDCLTCFASREFLPLPNEPSPDFVPPPLASRSSSRLNISTDNIRATINSNSESLPISISGPLSAEEAFLEFIAPFLPEGFALGSYVRGSQPTIVNNLLVQIPFKYLLRQGCSNVLIDWCCRMSVDMPDFLSLEAKARRKTPPFTGHKDHSSSSNATSDDSTTQDSSSTSTPQTYSDSIVPPTEQSDEDAYSSCVNALLQSIVDHPDSLDNLVELSLTLMNRGERTKAIEYAQLVANQYPEDARALHCAARIFALTNQPELALNYLLSVPVRQPPPCKDFVGVAFHRYATEPHYDYPNADQCRRIEEVDLIVIEESEADLSLSRANLNKVERQFYRIFHIIKKISGRDVLVNLIRQRAPLIKDAQDKARIEQQKAIAKERENRAPPRSKRAQKVKKIQVKSNSAEERESANKDSSSDTNNSSNLNSASESSSSASTPPNSSSPAPDQSSHGDSNRSESETHNSEQQHASPSESERFSLPPISKSTLAQDKQQESSIPATETPPIVEEHPDFFVIDMDTPLPSPLAYQLDVTYDTVRYAYLSLLEDLRTVEKWTFLPSMSVAALVRLGLIHKRLGAHDLALEAFETAMTLGWSFRGCRELCFLHVQAGKVRQALECADRNLRHLTHRWSTSYPDWQLRAALWRLVSRKSLKHVLHILENLQTVNDWHPFLRRSLEDAPYHQVDNSSLL